MDSLKETLSSICELWTTQARLCEESKENHFGRAAKELMQYVGKEYRTMRLLIDDSGGETAESATVSSIMNYTAAFVDIMTPYVLANVPNRLVGVRAPELPPELQLLAPPLDPNAQLESQPVMRDELLESLIPAIFASQQAMRKRALALSFLMQWWLNFCPKEYNLSREGKMAVREAFGKGRGTLWLEMIDSSIGPIPSSNADSVDNLLIDADATTLRDAGYIIRKRRQVNYRIAEIWKENIENLRSNSKSAQAQAAAEVNRDWNGRGDVGEYFEIWSVIGMGHKLVNAPEEMQKLIDPFYQALEAAGPFVHFGIMPGLDHPLGMDPELLTATSSPEEFAARITEELSWPIKTYENADNPWPVKPLDFLPHMNDPWSSSPLELALPLQRFIDSVYQTLLHRCKTIGRDIVVTSTILEEAVHAALESGEDLEIIRTNEEHVGKAMEDLIGFLRFPEMKRDVLQILALANDAFRELTGLDPAQFGAIPMSQDRSAKASGMREAGLSRRPDDYADTVESWQSDVSAGEALASRMLVGPRSIAMLASEPVQEQKNEQGEVVSEMYGPLVQLWMALAHTDDPAVAAAEVAYTVEAGSGRRRNKQLLQENVQRLFEIVSPVLTPLLANTGDIEPFVSLLQLAAQAYDIPVEMIVTKMRQSITKTPLPTTVGGSGATAPKPAG